MASYTYPPSQSSSEHLPHLSPWPSPLWKIRSRRFIGSTSQLWNLSKQKGSGWGKTPRQPLMNVATDPGHMPCPQGGSMCTMGSAVQMAAWGMGSRQGLHNRKVSCKKVHWLYFQATSGWDSTSYAYAAARIVPSFCILGSSSIKWAQYSSPPSPLPCHCPYHSIGHISETALPCCYLTVSAPQTRSHDFMG